MSWRQDSRGRRQELRHRTLPLRVWLCNASLPFMVDCILRDRSASGAQIEFENVEQCRGAVAAHVSSYVWINIPSEEVWLEAVVRWAFGSCLGLSFVGAARRSPPSWVRRVARERACHTG